MGLTKAEQRVVDLWDDGHSMERIHRITGIAWKQVQDYVSQYGGGKCVEARRLETSSISGSAKLLIAIQHHHSSGVMKNV